MFRRPALLAVNLLMVIFVTACAYEIVQDPDAYEEEAWALDDDTAAIEYWSNTRFSSSHVMKDSVNKYYASSTTSSATKNSTNQNITHGEDQWCGMMQGQTTLANTARMAAFTLHSAL